VAAAVVCIRAGQIQILEGAQWGALAEAQHTADREVVAARGAVLDRDGAALAVSREVYRVSVAPKEILDRDSVRTLLREVLDLSPARVRALMDRSRRWAVAPGRYPPTVRERLGGVRGVYLEREMERYHPHVDLARGVLGAVMDGKGKGGVEQAFESILRGQPGRAAVPRDNVGRPIPGETYLVTEPRSGGQVVLTLDLDMQEIARQALQEAIESTQARGGDVLVTDPATGEILAMVSIRDGKTAGLGAINTPYEPGSTLKPFTVAGLLSRGLRSLSDLVEVGDGTWTVEGRTLHDSHHPEQRYITISDALRVSSNVGIAKAAQVFTAADQYLNLRDFGFGSPTGIDLPGESAGRLRRPDHWSLQSPASLAIGYEIGVTPLQMAMAYGALANGGLLMEPRLVKEVRDADGRVLERRAPRVVRRVVRPEVARNVGRVLVDVVEDGTGTKARLGTFRVAGKSGTSRAYSPEGGYAGGHNASFVGFFPAEDPQLVIFVRLERPQGADYYGGGVAAPVTRATMEAALAARGTPLNRAQLVKAVQSATTRPAPVPVTFAAQPVDPPPPPVFGDEAGPGAARGDKGDGEPSTTEVGVPVPDVAGLPTRIAVRRLHALGLRVVQDRRGDITGTSPSAGSRVTPGDTVVLVVRRRSDD
jgi:cell division protein FtsI (penicillin-binding protein 3)